MGSQFPEPHLEDSSTYHPLRPTTLDEIKNFRDQVHLGVVVEAPVLPRLRGLEWLPVLDGRLSDCLPWES